MRFIELQIRRKKKRERAELKLIEKKNSFFPLYSVLFWRFAQEKEIGNERKNMNNNIQVIRLLRIMTN